MKSDPTSQENLQIVSQMVGCKYQIEPTKKALELILKGFYLKDKNTIIDHYN